MIVRTGVLEYFEVVTKRIFKIKKILEIFPSSAANSIIFLRIFIWPSAISRLVLPIRLFVVQLVVTVCE